MHVFRANKSCDDQGEIFPYGWEEVREIFRFAGGRRMPRTLKTGTFKTVRANKF